MLSLLILLILPARPPRQSKLAKMWDENWSMGGKVSNGLILSSNQNVVCFHVCIIGSTFSLFFKFRCYRVASLLRSLIYSEGFLRLLRVVSTRRETRCLTNSNQQCCLL